MDSWRKILACNRCADFEAERRRLCRGIVYMCGMLHRARITEARDLNETEATTRNGLTIATRRLAELISNFLRSPTVWSTEFVDILMERPDYACTSLDFYWRTRRKNAAIAVMVPA